MDDRSLLETYRDGAGRLLARVRSLPEGVIDFRPALEDAWTVREHIIHLVDSEINAFIRIKSIIAQPGSSCYVMDEDAWTRNIRRKNEDLDKYIAAFGLMRGMVYDLLVDEDVANWDRDYFTRDYNNEVARITIRKALELYVRHCAAHLEYIDRNVREFNRTVV